MGNWILEVGRMALYMSFPVALFHYFNEPEYFENYVISMKRRMYPQEDDSQHEAMENVIRLLNEKQEEKAIEQYKKFQADDKLRKENSIS